MNTLINRYHEAYLSGNDTYSYRDDDDCLIKLVAGVDGVTAEHIAALKKLHRYEVNNERRHSGVYYKKGECIAHVVHIDACTSDQLEYMDCFADRNADVESNHISNENVAEIKTSFLKAWETMNDRQKQLFIDIKIKKLSQKEVARRQGISPSAVNQQLAQIKKICKLHVNCLNFGVASCL